MKTGSNWISCSLNLMLTDFRPNWPFFCFRYFRLRGQRSKSWSSYSRKCITSLWYTYGTLIGPNVVLTLVMVPGLFYLKTEVIGVKKSKKRQGMCHLDDTALTSSVFFLLSSNNDCFFFHMLDWMFTKLGQKHVWVYGYKTYGSKNSPGVIWSHRGQKR